MKTRKYKVSEIKNDNLPMLILEEGETRKEVILLIDDLRKKGYNEENVKYLLEIDDREIMFSRSKVKNRSQFFAFKNGV